MKREFCRTPTRAYHPNLIRNNFIEALIVEYRLRIYKFIHAGWFFELAHASDDFFEFKTENFSYSTGPGLRFKLSKSDDIFLRIDYGFGIKSGNYHVSFYNYF